MSQFQIPIFDFGEVRVRQAAETYKHAFNRLTERAVNVRSQARDAYRVYRSTYDIASHYQREILPLRKIISEEMLLRFIAACRSTCSRCSPRRGSASRRLRGASRPSANSGSPQSDLQTAVNGGGAAGASGDTSTTIAAAAPADGGH